MDSQIAMKNAHKRYRGRVIFGGTAKDSISNIEVNSEYPLVSFITMIAPSPDWFLGVRDLNLCDTTTGNWQDREVRDLFPYDAGTDSGLKFASSNKNTDPRENIHRITKDTAGSLKSNEAIKRFGTFTFVKTSENNVRVTSAPSTTPSGTANPGTSINVTLLLLCIWNIAHHLL
jgi:hypothetical protein